MHSAIHRPFADSHIEFVPVSIAMARNVGNDLPAGLEQLFDAIPGGWEKFRQAQTREDRRLTTPTMHWLSALPAPARPMRTAVRFPHVLNRLAAVWGLQDELDAYFDSLLNSRRRNRKGFPPEVHAELVTLHGHALSRR